MRYHERTKHRFNRYADGPRQLDWANQPNPFRRFEGAPLVHLPLLGEREAPLSPRFDDLYRRGSVPSADVTIHALSRLLQYALAISAWKQAGATRWALRCNPSSGNLHPTEGYLLIDALPGLAAGPGLYHYAPREHGLERRAHCSAQLFKALMSELPAQAFLVGFSSIHWREAWKYGERAFRYCQHGPSAFPGVEPDGLSQSFHLSPCPDFRGHLCLCMVRSHDAIDDQTGRVLGAHGRHGSAMAHYVCAIVWSASAWNVWRLPR